MSLLLCVAVQLCVTHLVVSPQTWESGHWGWWGRVAHTAEEERERKTNDAHTCTQYNNGIHCWWYLALLHSQLMPFITSHTLWAGEGVKNKHCIMYLPVRNTPTHQQRILLMWVVALSTHYFNSTHTKRNIVHLHYTLESLVASKVHIIMVFLWVTIRGPYVSTICMYKTIQSKCQLVINFQTQVGNR